MSDSPSLNSENSGQTEQQENPGTEQPKYITSEEFAAKFAAIEESLNKGLNGIAKKFETKLETITKQPEVKPETTEEKLTIEALKADYEKKMEEVKQSSVSAVEALKAELAAKDRSEFQSNVKSQLSGMFAKNKFDDVEAALTVFTATHQMDNFQKGSDGIVLYKVDDSKHTTLESLIDDWIKSPIGKRFIPVANNIPNGSGKKESKTVPVVSEEGLSATEKLLKSRKLKA